MGASNGGSEEITFNLLDLGGDHAGAVTFADDTTVQRVPAERGSPFVVVEASFTGHVDERVVQSLKAAGRGAWPLKWASVREFVACGTGSEALAVRNALGDATIVVVDPGALLRDVDITVFARDGLPPLSLWYDRLPHDVRKRLDRAIAGYVIDTSGAGRVHDMLVGPMETISGIGVDLGDGDGAHTEVSADALFRELGERIGKAARFAAKSTTLIAYEHDPDDSRILSTLGGMPLRFLDGGYHLLNRLRLEMLASRRVVFDRGHEDEVRLVARLQKLAQDRAELYAPYLGSLTGGSGYVTSRDDREELRLQIADVAAGWARDIMQSRGMFEAGRTFRLVLYNGARLDADKAKRLDEERAFHRRLVASAIGQG